MPCTLRPGDVLVVEGARRSWIHRAIAWSQGWWWTHCFVVTGADTAVEAAFPRVQEFKLAARLAFYAAQQREVYVLRRYEVDGPIGEAIAAKARSYVGRWYNVLAVVWFFVFRTFTRTGGKSHWFCSRVVTASYRAAGIALDNRQWPGPYYSRDAAMRDGYWTPMEVFSFGGFGREGFFDKNGAYTDLT